MSKLLVVADKQGKIIATSSTATKSTPEAVPPQCAMIPEPHHVVYEVDVPDEILSASASVLHEDYELKTHRDEATIVRRKGTGGGPSHKNNRYVATEGSMSSTTYIPVPWSRRSSIESSLAMPLRARGPVGMRHHP